MKFPDFALIEWAVIASAIIARIGCSFRLYSLSSTALEISLYGLLLSPCGVSPSSVIIYFRLPFPEKLLLNLTLLKEALDVRTIQKFSYRHQHARYCNPSLKEI